MIDQQNRTCLFITLAAGEGTRMRSSLPKVLHQVGGLPMVSHVVDATLAAGASGIAVVVGNQAEKVAAVVQERAPEASLFVQKERLGTGHAVLAARDAIAKGYDDIVVLFGDTPLTQAQTLQDMRSILADGADLVVLGFIADDPHGYGRLVEEDGQLVAIREHKEASAAELEIDLCNGGIMAFRGDNALEMLDAIDNKNSKGEYYLTDLVEVARARGLNVVTHIADETEILGINNRAELAKAEALWQGRFRHEAMLAGVSMPAPETVFFQHDTVVEPDVTIEQNVVFGPGVTVHSGAVVRAFSHLEGAVVGSGAVVGPYARLRPGADLRAGSKVGNFCEIKKSVLEEGAKVNHLTYIGDATVGAAANVGAGTITCNYDGVNKHQTDIGAGAFIGSNSSLVAPVRIGTGAYVASGSVITQDVPDNAMGIGRGRQAIKEDYANEIETRNLALKKQKQTG